MGHILRKQSASKVRANKKGEKRAPIFNADSKSNKFTRKIQRMKIS